MRVYFSGSHSSGKTTLARYVAEHYELPLLPEAARLVLSERELQLDTLRYDMNLVDSYQEEVFNRQLAEEAKHKEFVSDRSAIDCLAYSAQHTRIFPKLLKHPKIEDYITSLKDTNSILFFVKPNKITLKPDGTRETLNWDGIIAIDAMIKLLLEMHCVKYISINTHNMQERIKIIDSTILMMK